jgi:hypothetical protein
MVGVKRPVYGADFSPLFLTENKNVWALPPLPLCAFITWYLGTDEFYLLPLLNDILSTVDAGITVIRVTAFCELPGSNLIQAGVFIVFLSLFKWGSGY